MHLQVLNFQLKDMSDADYRKLCDELAPAFAAVPGLLAKEWLADPSTNTYGGVYHWRDARAMQEFAETELFRNVASHPGLTGYVSTDFEIMEGPTRVTGGFVGVA